MRKRIERLLRPLAAGALACAVLASCAGLVGPRQVELPLEKLQAGMDRRFPMNSRLLELFDISLSRPRLAFLPDSDRVALTMDASLTPPFLRQGWRGSMALSGRLYVDAARNAVLMGEPRVDRFTIDGMDELRQRQLSTVANVLMDQLVGDMPVYSFRPGDLRYAGVQFVPTAIRATSTALVVTVEPAR